MLRRGRRRRRRCDRLCCGGRRPRWSGRWASIRGPLAMAARRPSVPAPRHRGRLGSTSTDRLGGPRLVGIMLILGSALLLAANASRNARSTISAPGRRSWWCGAGHRAPAGRLPVGRDPHGRPRRVRASGRCPPPVPDEHAAHRRAPGLRADGASRSAVRGPKARPRRLPSVSPRPRSHHCWRSGPS